MGRGAPQLVWLVERFLTTARAGMDDVDAALEAKDAPSVFQIAHVLTASSGMLGARALSILYRELMSAAAKPDLEAARERAGAVRSELIIVDAWLSAWLAQCERSP